MNENTGMEYLLQGGALALLALIVVSTVTFLTRNGPKWLSAIQGVSRSLDGFGTKLEKTDATLSDHNSHTGEYVTSLHERFDKIDVKLERHDVLLERLVTVQEKMIEAVGIPKELAAQQQRVLDRLTTLIDQGRS
mgnify:CR=1 FL=1